MDIRRALEEGLEGNLLISRDIAVAEDTTFSPGMMYKVPILLPEEDEFLTNLYPAAYSVLNGSTRSRFAQLGLEVAPGAGFEIARTLEEVEIERRKRKIATVHVINHAARPIKLLRGTEFFYLYYWDKRFLRGTDLVGLLGTDILLSGKEGEDWVWWHEQLPNGGQGEVWGIELFLDPTSFATIPAHPDSISISHSGTANHIRHDVDQYLRSATKPEGQLYIGEIKSHMIIGPNIHGVLDQIIATYDGEIALDEFFYQTNSVILQGGNTNSHIRVEVFCGNRFPSSVFVKFARAVKR